MSLNPCSLFLTTAIRLTVSTKQNKNVFCMNRSINYIQVNGTICCLCLYMHSCTNKQQCYRGAKNRGLCWRCRLSVAKMLGGRMRGGASKHEGLMQQPSVFMYCTTLLLIQGRMWHQEQADTGWPPALGQQGATSTDDSRTKTGLRPTISINRAFYCYSLLTNPIFWISMPVSANQRKWKVAILAWRKIFFFLTLGKERGFTPLYLGKSSLLFPELGHLSPVNFTSWSQQCWHW